MILYTPWTVGSTRTVVRFLRFNCGPEPNKCTGNSDDVIQLESLSVSPDPPKPGQELTITAVGVALKPIKVSPDFCCVRRSQK